MSLSKSQGPGAFEDVESQIFRTPAMELRLDRFCADCGGMIKNMLLERHEGKKCMHCDSEIRCLDEWDGIFRRCERCLVFIQCTDKFCESCGMPNQHYDPERPAQLEKLLNLKFRAAYQREFEAGELSLSFLDDVELSPCDATRNIGNTDARLSVLGHSDTGNSDSGDVDSDNKDNESESGDVDSEGMVE